MMERDVIIACDFKNREDTLAFQMCIRDRLDIAPGASAMI